MPDLLGALRALLIRLIAAGLMLTVSDALLPKGEAGAAGGARRLIRLALAAAVLFRIPN
jgi:hypothetical protein